MNARTLMTREVVCVTISATLSEVVRLMHDEDVRHVPVVEGRYLRGVVSDRDVRTLALPMLVAAENPGRQRFDLGAGVADVMLTDVLTAGPEATVDELIDLMLDHKVGAIPVIDHETDYLLGIVSYIDVLRAARDVL